MLPLDTGFANDELELVTEQDMLGDRLVRRKKRKKDADAFLAELSALNRGDLVVHIDHGIGKLPRARADHRRQEPARLRDARVRRRRQALHPGREHRRAQPLRQRRARASALDRLGGEAWQKRKARLKERIREIANELLRTAAARALRQAPVLVPETAAYDQFVDRFPWEETDDQERAIEDVLSDLAEGKPMDRLVCGDVGFGKTEVALRAAFVAAMDGPAGRGRRADHAARAPALLRASASASPASRSRSAGCRGWSRRRRPRRPARGSPTARWTSSSAPTRSSRRRSKFKRLGLVIVDEEQRFGVTHKEKLKQLRADVHVLTLTATPIPRTLQMAMSGLRELSTIQTPPVDRLAVRTYVMEWDDMVMREALLREHHRGGQSFIVVPRIADMAEVEEWLHKTRARDQVRHRARPDEPDRGRGADERVLREEVRGAALDHDRRERARHPQRQHDHHPPRRPLRPRPALPAARPRRPGQAARLCLPDHARRTRSCHEVAEKRLKVLGDLDALGAGFQLASHDLDIRGAGNLLGDEQSGHIREVGFELYQSMLEDAILAAKAGEIGLRARARRRSARRSPSMRRS